MYFHNNPLKFTDPNGKFITAATALTYLGYTAMAYAIYSTGRTFYYEGLDAGMQSLAISAAGFAISMGVDAILSSAGLFTKSMASLSDGLIFCGSSVASDYITSIISGSVYGWDSFGMSMASGFMKWGQAATKGSSSTKTKTEENPKLKLSNEKYSATVDACQLRQVQAQINSLTKQISFFWSLNIDDLGSYDKLVFFQTVEGYFEFNNNKYDVKSNYADVTSGRSNGVARHHRHDVAMSRP